MKKSKLTESQIVFALQQAEDRRRGCGSLSQAGPIFPTLARP
jgi:hypothetical protein